MDDPVNGLYIRCAGPDEGDNGNAEAGEPSTDKREERHYLNGQVSDVDCDTLIGLEKAAGG
jgi:hypothetical protein